MFRLICMLSHGDSVLVRSLIVDTTDTSVGNLYFRMVTLSIYTVLHASVCFSFGISIGSRSVLRDIIGELAMTSEHLAVVGRSRGDVSLG